MRLIRRLSLLALVAGALAPGTWVRSPLPVPDVASGVAVQPISLWRTRIGQLDVVGAWQLRSNHASFGSYSSLLALGNDEMLAASDRGAAMRFSMKGGEPAKFRLSLFGDAGPQPDKYATDIESLAFDPVTGNIWAGYEGRNMIERRLADLSAPKHVQPTAMQNWSGNSGPEAMARLGDGRFIVLSEGSEEWMGKAFDGLLWPGDPLGPDAPIRFFFHAPEDFRPTDMTTLPDGRVLILARRVILGLPPFEAVVLVADPAEISRGQVWRGTELARLTFPFPIDNYEGLAVDPADQYPVTLTAISDDNDVSYQRTLLLRLSWDGTMPKSPRR